MIWAPKLRDDSVTSGLNFQRKVRNAQKLSVNPSDFTFHSALTPDLLKEHFLLKKARE